MNGARRGFWQVTCRKAALVLSLRVIAWALVLAAPAACPAVAGETAAPVRVAQAAGWQADVDVKKTTPAAKPDGAAGKRNTTVIERDRDAAGSGGQVRLVALLTVDGQQIDDGLVWRVYQSATGEAKSKLVAEKREGSPELDLEPGEYTVNASFGRAHLTRKLSVKAGETSTERFVLNAGGLRVSASLGGKPAPEGSVTYAVYSDDRDQFATRTAVMTGAKPGLVIRLNAGIYHIVSTYGDANASVSADVTVEAGKLTEAAVVHQAAKAAFKLVTRAGGEALPDTHWTIQSADGDVVKESVGALPTHVLAPGTYTVLAKSAGRVYKRSFSLKEGDMSSVEVVASGSDAPAALLDEPLEVPELKNP